MSLDFYKTSRYHSRGDSIFKAISQPDQLLTYYVMDISGYIPGLAGLFVAGILSAALSTMSSNLNSLGATLFEDFIRPCMRNKIADKTANRIVQSIVVIVGCICVAIVFIVDKLGAILQLSLSIGGVTGGASLGLFSFGMFYPRGNSKGALAGSISSLLFMCWVVFGTQTAIANGSIKHSVLPMRTEGCGLNDSIPEPQQNDTETEDVFVLYRLSFMYYTFIGMAAVFTVGIIVSLLTEPPNLQDMNPALFTPIVRGYVERKIRRCKVKETAEMERLNVTCD